MNRASKSIGLVLVSSAAVLLGFHACDSDGSQEADNEFAQTQPTTGSTSGQHLTSTHRGVRRPWWHWGRSDSRGSTPSRSWTGSGGGWSRSGSSSGSQGSHSSRGGFGSSGHSAGA